MKARRTKPTKPQSGSARENETARSNETAAQRADAPPSAEGWGWLRPEEIGATFDDAAWDQARWAP